MHKYIKVRNSGVPIQISEGLLDLLSKSIKNPKCCLLWKVLRKKVCVA